MNVNPEKFVQEKVKFKNLHLEFLIHTPFEGPLVELIERFCSVTLSCQLNYCSVDLLVCFRPNLICCSVHLLICFRPNLICKQSEIIACP